MLHKHCPALVEPIFIHRLEVTSTISKRYGLPNVIPQLHNVMASTNTTSFNLGASSMITYIAWSKFYLLIFVGILNHVDVDGLPASNNERQGLHVKM